MCQTMGITSHILASRLSRLIALDQIRAHDAFSTRLEAVAKWELGKNMAMGQNLVGQLEWAGMKIHNNGEFAVGSPRFRFPCSKTAGC